MHFKKLINIVILFFLIFCCEEKYNEIEPEAIIPKPSEQISKSGEFILKDFYAVSAENDLDNASIYLMNQIDGLIDIKLNPKHKSKIEFIENLNLKEEEYYLDVSKKGISIQARDSRGAFYAVQSLFQLFPKNAGENNEIIIPFVNIKDSPQFSYRGMHLDVGRHMYSVDFIKKYIDAIAMLKMNTFHWHLTEDQGWRIEIKKYPKLQEVAAYRDETLVGHYSDQPHQFDGKRYGGHYTQEEIKDIVAYAQNRFVTIIPEIEMPGHSQAAIAAYPELGCTGEQVEVATKWGVFEDIYCTKDETFNFLEDVLDEVLELFPSKYIHIGGDEAPKTRWKTCKDCQKRIKDEGLKDEHELQNYFITRMEKYLNSKGRQIIGWDEILEGGLAPNATVMSWRGTSGAVEAAKSGHNVVMTPTSHCYFDYYQSDNEDEPLAIGGFLPLEKVYGFNPIPEELTKEDAKFVLGAQGNIWTEYMPTEEQVEYMAFPRMLAMSEVLWSKPENKNYKNFVSRLENFHKRLDALDINYANHLYEIEGNMLSEDGKAFYDLITLTEGKTIRYTLDGSAPNVSSKIYKSRIPIVESTIIKAAVFNSDKQLGKNFTQNINFHKAVGAKIYINKQPHIAYSGSGSEGLINGIRGSDSRYGDKEWLGFWGEDIEIKIDFKKPIKINSIKTRFYNGNGQWIYSPKEVNFEFTLEEGTKVSDKRKLQSKDKLLIKLDYDFITPEDLNVKVKSFTLKIPNYGKIPEGKQGAGNKAWTFIDEIIVN
ncbi:beta-N-acetylhexosaminidase [Winogradskyella immobilis]|uniref:beta-N-acetylhexosaminidase n=1 Tax=Winogradskyella immobilis TaxID=2816852 RepID=A0ABS8EJE5_9FLAO|nr:family 20 glycosylhydrolase [Winogradskyella immobilis]MCC1482977.1 family 20 glycosylhydrolase [Winogradskyella immobilis]MCG0015072.1 family 20 glycosylhydrolase [Winogradskyella immobilis]